MNKSNFQLLAEDLEQEVVHLAKELQSKKNLIEAAPQPVPSQESLPPYPSNPNVVPPNQGFVAGTYGVNADTVVQNPNVLASVRGQITKDSDPRVVKYKPYYSDNLATMMGFGIDKASFDRAKTFINQYAPPDGGVVEKDDPEQSTALDWKRLNNAVSNYNSQRTKDKLAQNHLFRGPATSNYEQGVSDQYQRFDLTKRAKKVADETANEILTGKSSRAKGKDVAGYIRELSQGQKERMGNIWSQNPDQSGKIQLRK